MPHMSACHPPNPQNIPPLLTRPTGRCRFQAALVVASLFLLMLVYVGLIVGFGGFSVWAILQLWNLEDFRDYGPGGAALTLTLLALGGFSAGPLALYFIKGLLQVPRSQG